MPDARPPDAHSETPPPPSATPATAPPGWYLDASTGQRRWWDGTGWTNQYQPASGPGRGTAALVLGIIAAALSFVPGVNWVGLVIAVVAVILGIVGLGKPAARSRSLVGLILGGAAFVLSIVLGVIYTLTVFAILSNEPSGAGPQDAPIVSHSPATTTSNP